jgi:DNA-binding transcriptional ArsR family regulator
MTADLSVLAALADPTRWRLLDTIAAHGGTTATVLAADLPVTRQAVVKHLGVLERVGLVSGRRAGREMRYSVRVERLDETARWMSETARRWDHRLAAIKRLAEAHSPADDSPAEVGRSEDSKQRQPLLRPDLADRPVDGDPGGPERA